MKRNSTIIIMTLLLLISFGKIHAQVVDVCAGNDTVELRLGNYHYCFVQWQVSDDNEFWLDIEGAVDTVYRFLQEYPRYYRAKVRFPACMEYSYYSQVSYVWSPSVSQPTIITSEITEIAQHAAIVEGNVVDDGGVAVTQRGICWSTAHEPTVSDDHTTNGSGTGLFSCLIDGLEANMTYYVRSFAINDVGTAYGNEVSFITLSGSGNYLPEGATNGLFSVDSEHQVLFSKGNLQYQASANTWKIADYQWDFIGYGNNNISSMYNGWIDLFGWGTSGWHDNNDPYNVNYYPWSTSLDTVNPTYNVYGYGPSTNLPLPNLIGSSAYYDWGFYNKIFNGGNQTNTWRTLTHEEWVYVLNERSASTVNGVANARYAKAIVNGIAGVILFPDNYTHPDGIIQPININDGYAQFTLNNYQGVDWETMEDVGAVFLPAAGGRYYGTSIFFVGTTGLYWSASYCDSESAKNLYFNESCFYPTSACYAFWGRYLGLSVRLVRFGQEISTSNVTDISSTTAVCGGTVVSYDENTLLEHGVCWSTSHNPTINDNRVNVDDMGAFTVNITGLIPTTMYYVRAYATDAFGTSYGNEVIFFTLSGDGVDYEFVDLGLPSGTLWATCNVGANSPEEYGVYFAWGETQPKDYYDWITYQYCMGSSNTMTKYCSDSNYGYNGFTDDLTSLLPEDDAATLHWSSGWRIPTEAEWQELCNNTIHTWITQNGVNGMLFTASNGNSLFLPAAGYLWDDEFGNIGLEGIYWSSSLCTDFPVYAEALYFVSDVTWVGGSNRDGGRSMRPVCSASPSGNLPQVTTSEVTSITSSTATCGGDVVSDGGFTVTERGVCWSTNHNPTLNDYHGSAGAGLGSFVVTATGLAPSATYYVRAYATNSAGTAYGNEVSFTTSGGGGDHAYIDLGLPSGLLWATCNVGANTPEEYGDYFAWGEIQPKNTYSWNNYQHCNGSYYTLTKYCNYSGLGYNDFTDSLTILLPEDDAATANWGINWRMPTEDEWRELYLNTPHIWMTQNGVNGMLFTAANGNSLFLPAAGYRQGSNLEDADSVGYYWSSSLYINNWAANDFYFGSSGCCIGWVSRERGKSVRAVRSSSSPTGEVPQGAINGVFSVGEGHQVYFSQGNLQYQSSTDTWKFAENQWDYVGEDNNNISPTYDGWIDLFGWGTSGYDHGAVCYQPWSISENNTDYYAYGQNSSNLFDQTGKADWGYNPISNGGNIENAWRTLTNGEWEYVLNNRQTSTGIRYVRACVNNVNGVLLLPDDWDSSHYPLNNPNDGGASFNDNTISFSQWNSLESYGVVFFPAAGNRWGSSTDQVGLWGGYWSSQCLDSDYALDWYFGSGVWVGTDLYDRCLGHSVRLVQDTPNGSGNGGSGRK